MSGKWKIHDSPSVALWDISVLTQVMDWHQSLETYPHQADIVNEFLPAA